MATSTLPASWYSDPEVYERERRAVFAPAWHVVGRSEQVRRTGDYVAADVCGWRVVVVVDDDGDLRGFHNVCRHRAGPLVGDGDGHCAALVCRYHGWSYDLAGRLRNARDFGSPDADGLALWPVRAGTWRRLLFVSLDPDGPSLAAWMEPLAAACEPYDIEGLTFAHEVVHDVAANWKTYADNYMEGYHIPLVHPGLNRELDARRYRVEVGEGWARHTAPTRDGAVTSGTWLWRYPNLALNLYPDAMNVERFVPAGPRQTRIEYMYFFRGPVDPEVVRVSTDVTREDVVICEEVQRNLESGVYDTGCLSPRHENGVAALQAWVRAAVESESAGEGGGATGRAPAGPAAHRLPG